MNIPSNYLQKHISRIEEYKSSLSCNSFMATQEYMEANRFLGNYIDELKRLLQQETITSHLPILIGDIVEVKEKGDRGSLSLMVITPGLPDAEDKGRAYRQATYMSPMGSSLLLRKIGDKVLVHAGEKDYEYEIQGITRMEED